MFAYYNVINKKNIYQQDHKNHDRITVFTIPDDFNVRRFYIQNRSLYREGFWYPHHAFKIPFASGWQCCAVTLGGFENKFENNRVGTEITIDQVRDLKEFTFTVHS